MTETTPRSTAELEKHRGRVERLAYRRSEIQTALTDIQTPETKGGNGGNSDCDVRSASPSSDDTKNRSSAVVDVDVDVDVNVDNSSGYFVRSHNNASFFVMDARDTEGVLRAELERVEVELVEVCQIVQNLLGDSTDGTI